MAKLKIQYDNETDIPEAHKELFEERDGKWTLTGVEGLKTDRDVQNVKAALDKERKRASDLEGKLKKFSAFEDKDPDEVLKMLEEIDELRTRADAGGKDKDSTAKELGETKTKLRKAEDALKKLQADADKYKTEAETLGKTMKRSKLEAELTKHANALKVRSEAVADVLRYQDVFELDDDGKVRTRDNVGVTPGLSVEEWLAEQKTARPHWWPDSVGGGAGGSRPGGGGGENPFNPKAPNLTKIGQLMATDKARADQLARAAGHASSDAAVKSLAQTSASTSPR